LFFTVVLAILAGPAFAALPSLAIPVELLAEKTCPLAYDPRTPSASSAETPRVVALNYYKNTGRGVTPSVTFLKTQGSITHV